MRSVGVRELREHTSQLLREVREKGEEIKITSRGRVVARLMPPAEPDDLQEDFDALWAEMDRLAQELGERWPAGLSAAEALSQDRR